MVDEQKRAKGEKALEVVWPKGRDKAELAPHPNKNRVCPQKSFFFRQSLVTTPLTMKDSLTEVGHNRV
jgi:hypothetical protein